jgi:hypothetical protein
MPIYPTGKSTGQSLYRYSKNAPISETDPYGLISIITPPIILPFPSPIGGGVFVCSVKPNRIKCPKNSLRLAECTAVAYEMMDLGAAIGNYSIFENGCTLLGYCLNEYY